MSAFNVSRDEFVNAYFEKAMEIANQTIGKQIKDNGPINPRIDVEIAKMDGAVHGLDKVYEKFDVNKVRKGNEKPLESLLRVAVHNAVLTELGKQATDAGVKFKTKMEAIDATKKGYRFSEQMEYEKHYYETRKEEKAETLKKLDKFVHKLSVRDQRIFELWKQDPKNYVDNALIEFGWENTQKNRDALNRFFCRAKIAIRKMMTEANYTFRDGAIYSFKNSNAAAVVKLDANEVRRRRRAVYAECTKGIDYAGICEMLYEEIAK